MAVRHCRDVAPKNTVLGGDEARPRLYFIDFGLARHFDAPVSTWPGGQAQLPEAPPSSNATYDPFKGDVYALSIIFPMLSLVRLRPRILSVVP